MYNGKAAILAIGTELTTGQVTNRNAAWISEKLTPLGVEVVLHVTVADDRVRIKEALDQCAEAGQFLFVTGGLGPTTDDFTREVIAEWLNCPLEFDPASWEAIVMRLGSLGIPIAESNRQQCFFPRGSTILPNPEGTAAGFSSLVAPNTNVATQKLGAQQIWILPGPPLEIEAIWKQGIESSILKLNPDLKRTLLFSWNCMGKSEAELGEIAEHALQGSGLQTGYRAHRPYVEVKVWCEESLVRDKKQWINKLELAIGPWVITKQGEDLACRLLDLLSHTDSVEIFDSASRGALTTRLGSFLKDPRYESQRRSLTLVTEWDLPADPALHVQLTLEDADPESLTLALASDTSTGNAFIGMKTQDQICQTEIKSPYSSPKLIDRSQAYILEMALKIWAEWLKNF